MVISVACIEVGKIKNYFMDLSVLSNVLTIRDLQYILIWQYIDTLIKYRIVILCSINIEISKYLIVLSGTRLMLLI